MASKWVYNGKTIIKIGIKYYVDGQKAFGSLIDAKEYIRYITK